MNADFFIIDDYGLGAQISKKSFSTMKKAISKNIKSARKMMETSINKNLEMAKKLKKKPFPFIPVIAGTGAGIGLLAILKKKRKK